MVRSLSWGLVVLRSWSKVQRDCERASNGSSLVSSLELGGIASTGQHECRESSLLDRTAKHRTTPAEPEILIHTIFEGTSEIQRVVIGRALAEE
jgi:hypothetical protein